MMIHRMKRSLYRSLARLRMFMWVNPTILGFQNPKTRSFVIRGLRLIALAPKGSSLVDERLDPSCSKPRKHSIQQQLLHEFTPKSTITTLNKLLLAPKDRPQLQKVFIYPNTPDFKLKSSFSLTLKLTLFLFYFPHLKLFFFLFLSSLFFLLFFPLIFF